jgi:general secretion pathway protein A
MMTSLIPEDSGYLTHLGLSHNPFPVVPDDTTIFLSGNIEQIMAEIVHGVVARKGFMILTGDIGLGKTTISRRIISILEEKGIETALVLHTSLQDVELLREINRDFGINEPYENGKMSSLGEQLRQLNRFLVDQNQQDKNCAIIIDDAQNLNPQSLELVRMISNLEGGCQKLVQILLIGQPELAERLNTHELRQLRSRVVINTEAKPLNRRELKEYILFKLNSAGNHGQSSVTAWAINKLYRYTRGNFRLVNMLMDRCLYVTCLQNSREINLGVVKMAYQDLFPKKKSPIILWLATVTVPIILIGTMVLGQLEGLKRLGLFNAVSAPASLQSAILDTDLRESYLKEVSSTKIYPEQKEEALPDNPKNSTDAVYAFLQPFGLARYTDKFRWALAHKEVTTFAHDLFHNTGYQLIELNHLNKHIRQSFGVLSLPKGVNKGPVHYVVWRPSIHIKKFYFYYQGVEIYYLQSLLARADVYHDKLDHIVGPHLMQAVVDFQKQNDLPVTGFPDSRTLFLLSHFQESDYID